VASYNLKFNKDDSVIRHILIGLIADLDKKLNYWNTVNGEDIKVDIPFYLSLTGDESFLYDHFLFDDAMDPERKKAIGNYEVKPRGVASLESMTIDSGALLNKYVRGTYSKLDEGKDTMKSYTAEFQMIPLVFTVNVKIMVDTQIEIFKVTEKIIKALYKNNQYRVDVGTLQEGTYPIPCGYKLPEDYEMERPIEFGFDDKKNRTITFTIELKARMPVFEPKTELFNGNRMFSFDASIQTTDNIDNPSIGGPDSMFGKTNN
jgi:hypothetical protein